MGDVSATRGRTGHPVMAQSPLELYAAVALLEAAKPGTAPVGETSFAAREAVRFRGSIDAAFPATDIVCTSQVEGRATLETAALSLAGGFGPLPQPFAELLRRRSLVGDRAMRDFLDIFNHRLISLLVRAHRASRPAPEVEGVRVSPFEPWLMALCGLGTAGLAGRLAPVADRAVLRHTAHVARLPATIEGLETILSDHFKATTRVTPLRGRRVPIEKEDQTALGRQGRNQALGRGAVAGQAVWDPTAGIRIEIEGLRWAAFLDLLPGCVGALALGSIVRFYAAPTLAVEMLLSLASGEARATPLRRSANPAPMLGRTSWLGKPPAQARVRSRLPDMLAAR